MGAKHFLVKGAKARVHERQFYDDRFTFGLIFEDETWINLEGIPQQVSEKHLYSFGESWLESANYEPFACEAL